MSLLTSLRCHRHSRLNPGGLCQGLTTCSFATCSWKRGIIDLDIELSARLRARLHRYSIHNFLLCYRTNIEDNFRIAVSHDEELKYRILYEVHDTALSGHLGREKTYNSVSQAYWWPKLYKWVSTYVRTFETCQRVKPSAHAAAPLASLPVPTGCWESMSMDFVFGLPKDSEGNTGIVVFVDRLSKMAHLAAVPDSIDAEAFCRPCVSTTRFASGNCL